MPSLVDAEAASMEESSSGIRGSHHPEDQDEGGEDVVVGTHAGEKRRAPVSDVEERYEKERRRLTREVGIKMNRMLVKLQTVRERLSKVEARAVKIEQVQDVWSNGLIADLDGVESSSNQGGAEGGNS